MRKPARNTAVLSRASRDRIAAAVNRTLRERQRCRTARPIR